MNKRHLLATCAILAVLALAGAGWFVHRTWLHENAAATPLQTQGVRVETIDGETVITMPADMQRAAGVSASPLAASTVRPEQTVYASVIELQPWIDAGTRMAAARADRDAARAQAALSQAQLARVRALFEDDRNASQKALQEARAGAQADGAKVAAIDAALAGLAAGARQQFGEVLARAAAVPGSDTARLLSTGRAAVVRVMLPAGASAPDSVDIEAPAGGTLTGRRLSSAPLADPMMQGAPFFYLVGTPLPAGTRLFARAARPGPVTAGVLVPDAAIVWNGDLRWVYVRAGGDRFIRRLVQVVAPTADGVFATGALKAGDVVVMRGAALLLSEEQKPRGVATQCKDPPECDD